MAEEPETTSLPTSTPPPPPPTPSEKSSQGTFNPQPQVPFVSRFIGFDGGDMQMFPVMYPAVIPGVNSQNQDQSNWGAGLYAVPVGPNMRTVAGLHSDTLIPLTYNIPTRQSSEAGAAGQDQGQVGQQQQQQNQQQHPHQRQVVVRRFQIAIQLDLLLILKLAAVIFLFNQDGSRQRLVVLVFFASLVYLYQTGALSPLIRWLSQGMQRAAAPPHPPRAAPAVAENAPPAAGGQGNENANLPAEGQAGAENENPAANDGNRAAEN
ncbi:uncharacterized protein LOC116196078 [Punica granatum]|uniref:Uncharacterized protein LOC116196078 n=1 Tax=Punica granatum TaxID=22663 RepID=A0A6P8CC73_PUNGR|nr:uncharacterized protein LOC116196078 [Punica granatum]